jgi:hypothetical protein
MLQALMMGRGQTVYKIQLLPYLPKQACRDLWGMYSERISKRRVKKH